MITISIYARNATGLAFVGLIDTGSLNPTGNLEFYTGTKPSSPQVAATGTFLASLAFSNPAFGSFSNGKAFANSISRAEMNIVATGVVGWFRVVNRDGVAVFDGDVTITGNDGDIELDNINFIKNGTVAIEDLIVEVAQ